jgi:glycosyltransferase involved in cell wall biosynthesis
MKIAILSTFDTFGGAAIAASRLNKALKKVGLQSFMIVQEKKGDDISVNSISDNWFQNKLSRIRFALDRLQFTFYEKSKKVRFAFSQANIGIDLIENRGIKTADIIHLHWVNFGFLSLKSIQRLISTNKPIVWTLHDMWAFTGGCHYSGECENYLNQCGNCTVFLKDPSTNDLSNKVWNQKNDILLNANITFVTCSGWLLNIAKKSSLIKNKNIITIPNPIDIEAFKPIDKLLSNEKLGLKITKKYILFGAIKINDERKGYEYFNKALMILKEKYCEISESIELLVFGKATASDFNNLPYKVNLLGQIADQNQIITIYNAATIFVVPSLEDNLPNTIMESMACGTPVVGFETGGIPEMIDHQKTGYLAKYKSAEDLANGIYWTLFDADYPLLCNNSRKHAIEKYSFEKVANQYKSLYESLQ